MAAGMRIAGLGLLLAVLWCAPARADTTYTVYYCQGPSGQPASAEGFTPISGKALIAAGCPADGIASGPPALTFTQGEAMGLYYVAPPSTRLVGYTLYRTVGLNNYFNWSLIEGVASNVGTATRRELCWTMAAVNRCSALGDGRVSPASRVGASGIDTAGLSLWIDCNPGEPPCGPDGAGHPRVVVHRLDAVLADRQDPVFTGTPSGDLLDTQRPLTGVRSVSYSASDAGGGLYQATLLVDGAPAVTQVVDDNGGRCREPFLYPVPCKNAASGTLSFDTGALPDGQHSLRLVLTDVTKTNSVSYGPVQVTTSNQSARCDPALTARTTPVAASFRGTPVLLLARESRTGARGGPVGQTTTGADGSFTLLVPPGPSRTLRAAVRLQPTNPLVACSRALKLRVPANVTLHVRPSTVRAGHSIRVFGRLRGGRVPRRGKLVALQAFERGRWQTFTTVRTNRRGSFSKRRGFSFTARGRSFRLRAQVRPEASYPFALGYSRTVRVRVR
jgi:hypothetical protein